MPRFVILTHDHPHLHWDFMLDVDGTLKTWRLETEPVPGESFETVVERLPDHRLAYLDYEGPVSNNRGTVTRWDCGEYTTLAETEQEWKVALQGERLQGTATVDFVSGKVRFELNHEGHEEHEGF